MVKAAYWLLCTYLTLKLIQFVFGGRPGFRTIELGFRERLMRGEPILFAVAFALSVPTALWSSWFVHRGYSRAFRHATDCYGRLRALDELADVAKRADAYRVYNAVLGVRGAAFLAARSLDLTSAAVDAPDRQDGVLHEALRQSFQSRRPSENARRGRRD